MSIRPPSIESPTASIHIYIHIHIYIRTRTRTRTRTRARTGTLSAIRTHIHIDLYIILHRGQAAGVRATLAADQFPPAPVLWLG